MWVGRVRGGGWAGDVGGGEGGDKPHRLVVRGGGGGVSPTGVGGGGGRCGPRLSFRFGASLGGVCLALHVLFSAERDDERIAGPPATTGAASDAL